MSLFSPVTKSRCLSLPALVEECLGKVCENLGLAIEAIVVLLPLGELGQVVGEPLVHDHAHSCPLVLHSKLDHDAKTYSSQVVLIDVLDVEVLVLEVEEIGLTSLGEVVVELGQLACHVYSSLT